MLIHIEYVLMTKLSFICLKWRKKNLWNKYAGKKCFLIDKNRTLYCYMSEVRMMFNSNKNKLYIDRGDRYFIKSRSNLTKKTLIEMFVLIEIFSGCWFILSIVCLSFDNVVCSLLNDRSAPIRRWQSRNNKFHRRIMLVNGRRKWDNIWNEFTE